MEKPAPASYPLHPLVARRWSPRAFEEKPVESWKLCSILEAARWAPSSFNEQPWRFFVGSTEQTPETHTLLQQLLMEGNDWARKAPVLMLSIAKLNFTYNDKPNRHAYHDVGLAVENMVIQALSLDLQAHQMAGFYVDKARDLLGIPHGYDPVAMMALGYPGKPEQLEGDLRQRELVPRDRQPLQEMVFHRTWPQPYPGCFT